MSFCTAINCMDGRVQDPVNVFLRKRFATTYVDVVSEAGPVRALASQPDSHTAHSIFRRVEVSIEAHRSKGLAVVAHHDCAGNPVPREEQIEQLRSCLQLLSRRYPNSEVIGIWVDEEWSVSEITL
ncbi:MAG: carbonic anhydrase [Rhodothermales bacterium]